MASCSSVEVPWSNRFNYTHAVGNRDVLIIVSEEPLDHPDVVERRPAIQLTEEVRGKLEHQGIPREKQCDDLTIMKARYGLDNRLTIYGVEMSGPGGERLTRESVYKQITSLMNNTDKEGVVFYYIGHGRRNTGDWCFEDGFITFRDLAELYLKIFRGHVMTLVSDCSHSGSWVKECMAFLDEQGVKPCGHSARDKGILIKVYTSCLSSQVPQQLAFSVHCYKNTGIMISLPYNYSGKITDSQHTTGMDFTELFCSTDSIDGECTLFPHATWQKWSAGKRIHIVRGEDCGRQAWRLVLLADNDETIMQFRERTQGENAGKYTVNIKDYGLILKSGWGEDPPQEAEHQLTKEYGLHSEDKFDLKSSRKKEEEFIKAVEDAIAKSGKISRNLAHLMFVGPPESGKSSLMDRLLNRLRKKFSPSTDVCDAVVIVDINITNPSTFIPVDVLDADTWKAVEYDESLVKQMGEENIVIPSQPERNCSEPRKSQNPAPSKSTDRDFKQEVRLPKRDAETKSTSAPAIASAETLFKKNISSVLRKYGIKNFKYSKKTNSLYLRDTGGQVEFQEMVALLVFGPSLFFFVFRLDLDFKSTFSIQYRTSDSESLNHYTSSITTEEALLQCLASVYAMDTSSEGSVKTHKSLVFIVGTHKDKLGPSSQDKIIELNQYLDSLIKKNGFEHLVQYANERNGNVMFAVDNTCDSNEDFKTIRSKVNRLITTRSEFSIDYPISYLLFCLDLQSIKENILTFEECKILAAKYDIVGDQVFHLLHFLHIRIGIVLHFNIEGLKHLVIKEPQVLFNKVTELIIKTFSSGSLTTNEAHEYSEKGILTASALKNVMQSDNEISSEDFLKFLVHLRIISSFSVPGDKEKRYFIPCVLDHVPESTLCQLQSEILSLAMKFKCLHCPKGVFGVLVTHLMTPGHECVTLNLLHKKIFKDQVSFEVLSTGVRDEISLRMTPSHLELNFFPDLSEDRDTPVKEVCNNVRQIIEDSLVKSLKNLHYNRDTLEPVMCFRCNQCSQLHQVIKGKKYYKIYCEEAHKTSRIPPHGRCWYNEESESCELPPVGKLSITKATPHQQSIDDNQRFAIVHFLKDLNNEQLVELGLELRLHYSDLQKMKIVPEAFPNDMIATWQREKEKISDPPSWTSLAAALEAVGQKKIITKIEGAILSKPGHDSLYLPRQKSGSFEDVSECPGILFHQEPIVQEDITFEREVILKGTGIELSIPVDSKPISLEEPLTLTIRTCFSGPFELPDDYESASPAYLIEPSRRVKFQRDVTVEIYHYLNLESEEDCDNMVFLSASITPEYRESRPVYTFKEIKETKGVFKPGYQVGEIKLRHFCYLKAAKRKNDSHSESPEAKKSKGNTFYYSARLYRSLPQSLSVFCICLYHEAYTKHCDSVVMEEDKRRWELSTEIVQLTSEEVTLSVVEAVGWNTNFDKEPTKIYKNIIHLPEELGWDISECPDYPPRFSLQCSPIECDPANTHSNLIKLKVEGLDRELIFNIKVTKYDSLTPPSPATPETIPLTMDDHSNITEFLNDLNIKQLLRIGGKLGLSYSTLQKMKSLPQDMLGDMIAAWLREEDNVTTTSGHPSWTSLMTTLEKVGQRGIASKIKKAHLSHGQK